MILPEAIDLTGARLRSRSLLHAHFEGSEWYLMLGVAFLLLSTCFLIAGLTLGVCGLDERWLAMRSLTGTSKERKQALVILRMKRHNSWMLCSLIICSVTCGEYFPFVVEDLCGVKETWIPIMISTLLLAVCAEIIPQWLIPRHAVSWGYYCWPLIWGCMWLTSIVSYPLASLLDFLGADRKDELGLFTNDQLAVIIKYHEESERRGGNLSAEATRIILGVLNNDHREIGGEISRIPHGSDYSDKDLEKASFEVTRGMIVRWSAVKTIDINEVVDKVFIDKVLNWSYSRIPVVGKLPKSDARRNYKVGSEWDGTQVYGFLHIKNLINIDTTQSTSLPTYVRDLPLYPLPIITDEMPVYELLHMFQLGMSRIAVVVPSSSCLGNAMQDSSIKGPTFWTGTQRTNAQIAAKMDGSLSTPNWETNYMAAAKFCGQRVTGIRTPKPIGIVTFEDIVDSLLQRTSHDEKDFFDRKTNFPPTKTRKAGDARPSLLKFRHATTLRGSEILLDALQQLSNGSLRRRKASKAGNNAGLDGADERSVEDLQTLAQLKRREYGGSSSYTDNSQGGFHDKTPKGRRNCVLSKKNMRISIFKNVSVTPIPADDVSPMDNTASTDSSPKVESRFPPATLPSRRPSIAVTIRQNCRRHVSASPYLEQRPSVLSRQASSSVQSEYDKIVASTLVMPSPADTTQSINHDSAFPDKISHYKQLRSWETTGETASLSSWGDGKAGTPIYDADTVSTIVDVEDFFIGQSRRPGADETRNDIQPEDVRNPPNGPKNVSDVYTGFPLELLESNKENFDPEYSSKTMPSRTKFLDDSISYSSGRDTVMRRSSFRDDRARLPSQRKPLAQDIFDADGGNRSSSLWF